MGTQKESVSLFSSYPKDRLWTALRIDKKKQLTPLAAYVDNT